MANYRVVLEYDGTDYHGFQKQPGLPTIQEKLEKALGKVAVLESPLYVAGRTDAGVHARGQVVNFHGSIRAPASRLPNAANANLPRDIVVKGCREVEDGFHARRRALGREYVYYLFLEEFPSPFNRRFVYHCKEGLDLEMMDEAMYRIIGVHDFTSFCRLERGKSAVREVHEAEVLRLGDMVGLRVKANAFAWMMMRMLCGSLLEVGRGRWSVQRFEEVLAAVDNSLSGPALPPHGLFLERVFYS